MHGDLVKKVAYHRFPKDKQRRQQWATALHLNQYEVTDDHRVCSDHFFEKDFDNSLCVVRLRESAVPFVSKIVTNISESGLT
ncbi:THAP domain-containing protein 2-like isoform X1 [Athalia rosae]|uniref:THAP domain-containing protein 2-like isoform X1 n=1 Tax=Athalia rosae TaxID=37344 RepID=UPI002033E054|nr:THAP domain-containing protein 2-like isoform X1 [Athalia rosae]